MEHTNEIGSAEALLCCTTATLKKISCCDPASWYKCKHLQVILRGVLRLQNISWRCPEGVSSFRQKLNVSFRDASGRLLGPGDAYGLTTLGGPWLIVDLNNHRNLKLWHGGALECSPPCCNSLPIFCLKHTFACKCIIEER